MRRAILGLVTEPSNAPVTPDSQGSWAIDVEETLSYLDGSEIQHGRAAEHQTTEKKYYQLAGDSVVYDRGEVTETVGTEFFADVEDAGFVAIDSSDGEFLFSKLSLHQDIPVYRAEFDLKAWAEYLADQEADWWQVGWRSENTDGETTDAGVAYHNGTYGKDPTQIPTSQLGFSYSWEGQRVRGTAAASGYVEVYNPTHWGPEQMAYWLREEVLPYVSLPGEDEESEQSTLEEGAEA